MDIGDICDYCVDRDCKTCSLGNPCLGCDDYDIKKDFCKSNGACGLIEESLTDAEMDRYAVQVQNGEGYYNSSGRYVSFIDYDYNSVDDY